MGLHNQIGSNTSSEIGGRFDTVTLMKRLPDYAHEPTLRLIDRLTSVVAPSQAEALLNGLALDNLTLLKHGATTMPAQKLPKT